MRRARTVVSVLVVLLLLAALADFARHAVRPRTISFGTPVPQPVAQLSYFRVPPGSSACLGSVAVDPGAQVAELGVAAPAGAGPPLRVTMRGGSFDTVAEIAGGYAAGRVAAPFVGPRRSVLARVCIRNVGRQAVVLTGTKEPRTLSRPPLTIGGRAVRVGEVSLAFASASPQGPLHVARLAIHRMTAFRPAWVTSWLVALLLAAVAVGAIAAPLAALWRSRDDATQSAPVAAAPRR